MSYVQTAPAAAIRSRRAKPRSRVVAGAETSEVMVQRRIISSMQMFGIWCVHVPNEAKRSMLGHVQAKRDGLHPGFPDLLLYRRGGAHGLLEVKEPGWKPPQEPSAIGRRTQAWAEWEERLRTYDNLRGRGFPVEVVTSWDEALEAVRAWGWVAR